MEPMYARFFAFIGLFAFGMFTLVVSRQPADAVRRLGDHGACSYLLIGFWYAKDSARNAAVKAFMTTRVGDVFMLLGIAYLYSGDRHAQLPRDLQRGSPAHLARTAGGSWAFRRRADRAAALHRHGRQVGAVPAACLVAGRDGRPDPGLGHDPCRDHGFRRRVSGHPHVPAALGGLDRAGLTTTMTVMAFIGRIHRPLRGHHRRGPERIKRVLAYSTISQLGYMIAALGIGAYVAAAFHLITHAFFKALLFLGSGSVIHGMEHGVLHTGKHHVDPQDMLNMGGLRKKMPITFWTFLIGGFALSGFPLVTAGFWSKDEILADAFGTRPHLSSSRWRWRPC